MTTDEALELLERAHVAVAFDGRDADTVLEDVIGRLRSGGNLQELADELGPKSEGLLLGQPTALLATLFCLAAVRAVLDARPARSG